MSKIKPIDYYIDDVSVKGKKAKREKVSKPKKKGKTRNKVIAIVVAAALSLGAIFGISKLLKRGNKIDKDKAPVTDLNKPDKDKEDTTNTPSTNLDETTKVEEKDVNDLGDELEFPKQDTSKYGDSTNGKVDKDKVVEKDSNLYVDQNAADKSDEVGDTKTDTKDDTLYVDPGVNKEDTSDDVVKEKEPDYEIHDGKTGEVVDSGDGEKSDDFAHDDELGKDIEKDKVGKYAYADQDYYGWIDENGKLVWGIVIEKGTLMSKEDLEKVKATYSTSPVAEEDTSYETQPSSPSNPQPDESDGEIIVDDGVVNPDGTYSLYDMKFRSKEDYDQWVLQGYTGYTENSDGLMVPEEEIIKDGYITEEEYEKQLQLR